MTQSTHAEQLTELQGVLTKLRPKVQEMAARLQSSAVALEDATKKLDRFTEVFTQIAAIHSPHGRIRARCITCDTPWPCSTASVLQGLM